MVSTSSPVRERFAAYTMVILLVTVAGLAPVAVAEGEDPDAPPTGEGSISGTANYTGSEHGNLIVFVWGGPSEANATVAVAAPYEGTFLLDGLANGTYNLTAFLDVDRDGFLTTEPACDATDETGAPQQFVIDGNTAHTGVHIEVPCTDTPPEPEEPSDPDGGDSEPGGGGAPPEDGMGFDSGAPLVYFGGVVNITLARDGVPVTGDDTPGDVFIMPAFDSSSEGGCTFPTFDEGSYALGNCNFAQINATTGTATLTGLADGDYDWDFFLYEGGSGFFASNITITGATTENIVEVHRTIEIPKPGYLTGRVVSAADDSAVADATIDVFGPASFASGSTNATGHFNVSVTPGTIGYDIRPPGDSGLKGYNPHCDPWGDFGDCETIAAGNATDVGVITLGAGGLITGFVQDTAGNPLVDIEVNAFSECPPNEPCDFDFAFDYIEWGSDGSYNLTVGAGTFIVEAFSFAGGNEQRAVATGVEATLGGTTWLNLTIGGGGIVQGTVNATDGDPVADVHIMVFKGDIDPMQSHQAPIAFAQTNQTGGYAIAGLPDGAVTLMFEPPFDSIYKRGHATTAVADNTTSSLNHTLQTGKVLKGYVRDGDGAGVSDADVGLFPIFCEGGEECFGGFSFTDSTGFYQIGGLQADTDYGMFVGAPFGSGLGSYMLDPFRGDAALTLDADTTTLWRNITLESGISLRGNVTMADGGTFPNDVFDLWADAFGSAGWAGGPVRLNDDRTEATFSLDGLAPGTYTIRIEAFGSNLAPIMLDDIVIESGDDVTWIDPEQLEMSAGVCVAGTVKRGDGNPVPNAFADAFELIPPGSERFGAFGWDVTAADGTFSICGLSPGQYGLRVETFGDGDLAVHEQIGIQVTDGDCPACNVGDVVLAAGVEVTGTVQTPDGDPVQGFAGIWNPETGAGSGAPIINGAFSISVAEGTYEVEIWPDPFAHPDLGSKTLRDQTVDAGGLELGEITLSTGGALSGRILDAAGDPVSFAFIHVESPDGFAFGSTGSDGRFRVSGVSATAGDSVDVFIEPSPGSNVVAGRQTLTWAPDDSGLHDMGSVTLTGGQPLTVTVQEGGSAVAFATVDIWPSDDSGGSAFGGRSRTTDANGQVTFRGLPDGTYDIAVETVTSGYFFPANVTINGAAASTTLEFAAPAGITVTVENATAAIQGAEVEVYNTTSKLGDFGLTDVNGQVTLSLTEGEYTVKVLAEGHKTATERNVLVTDGSTRTIVLEAQTPGSINGTLSGGTTSQVTVVAVDEADSFVNRFATSGNDGAFNITGLSAGTYTVFAVLDGDKYGCRSGVELAEGQNVALMAAIDTDQTCGEIA